MVYRVVTKCQDEVFRDPKMLLILHQDLVQSRQDFAQLVPGGVFFVVVVLWDTDVPVVDTLVVVTRSRP